MYSALWKDSGEIRKDEDSLKVIFGNDRQSLVKFNSRDSYN